MSQWLTVQWKNNSDTFIKVEWWGAWNKPRVELPERPFVHSWLGLEKVGGYMLHILGGIQVMVQVTAYTTFWTFLMTRFTSLHSNISTWCTIAAIWAIITSWGKWWPSNQDQWSWLCVHQWKKVSCIGPGTIPLHIYNFCPIFLNTQKKQISVYCSFWVSLSNIYMYQVTSKVDNQWVHLVLNFIGPEERFQVFRDGALVPGQQTKAYFSRPLGDGRLVLGKRFPHMDNFYSSIDVDELVFFNRKFTEQEVTKLYNHYNWFFFSDMWRLSFTNFGKVILKKFSGKCDQWELLL